LSTHGFWFYFGYFIQLLFIILNFYYLTISLFAFIPRRYKTLTEVYEYDYALIIAAHNEEKVISNLIESLNMQNYNKEKYKIFVIADNCSDRTAEIAHSAGADVFERFDNQNKGKGAAMEWMFQKIFDMKRHFDFIGIFDADNLVDSNFLSEMNLKANLGNKVIQGYLETKNPHDSWITYSYAMGYWEVNKLFQESRDNLGLSCQLSGTGFIVSVDLIKKIGWGATCLTEDMEYTAKLVSQNLRVAFAKNAIVYDEKPVTFRQSWNQRIRWMQGHADVASRFVSLLVKKTFRDSCWKSLDCMLYLLQPLRILSSVFIYFVLIANILCPESKLVIWSIIGEEFCSIIAAFQILWLPFVLLIQGKLENKTLKLFPAYILYCLSWIPISFIGIITKNEKEWNHTEHVCDINISDIN